MTTQLELKQYPASPGWREPTTSRDAAASMIPKAETLRAHCLLAIRRNGGLTADECAGMIGQTPFSIRPRFTELQLQGLIEDSGLRRPNVSGRMAKVWRVVA